MTKRQFNRKFAGVLNRSCEWNSKTRGPAPWPEFNEKAINVCAIEHECRPKESTITYNEHNNSVDIDWMTQEECRWHTEFTDEILRWMEKMGIASAFIHLYDRDGSEDYCYTIYV